MNAKHDENGRPTLICASNADGLTIVPIYANGGLWVEDGVGGANNGNNGGNAILDENSVPVMTALSSVGDGSIVEVYANPLTNSILINSH